MKKTDSQLDHWLADADHRLYEAGRASAAADRPTGAGIRRRAARRQAIRSRRSRILAGAGVVGLVLAGWRVLIPDLPDDPPVAGLRPEPVRQILADVAALEKRRAVLDQRLRLLDLEQRLVRLQHQAQVAVRFSNPPEVTGQRNENAWAILQRVTDWEPRDISGPERRQLEFFVQGFPDTTAGSVAQTMLVTNRVSRLLCEKENEF